MKSEEVAKSQALAKKSEKTEQGYKVTSILEVANRGRGLLLVNSQIVHGAQRTSVSMRYARPTQKQQREPKNWLGSVNLVSHL